MAILQFLTNFTLSKNALLTNVYQRRVKGVSIGLHLCKPSKLYIIYLLDLCSYFYCHVFYYYSDEFEYGKKQNKNSNISVIVATDLYYQYLVPSRQMGMIYNGQYYMLIICFCLCRKKKHISFMDACYRQRRVIYWTIGIRCQGRQFDSPSHSF